MMSTRWHACAVEAVVDRLETSSTAGLSTEEAERRLVEFGPNDVTIESSRSVWPLLVRQFKGPLIAILVVAAGVSIAIGETLEAVAIAAIVIVNGVLGFIQEWRADRAIDELQAMFVQHATVVRSGVPAVVDAASLVPGDLIQLEPGDRVPADARVVNSSGLTVDESALTGESTPVWKTTDLVDEDASVGERSCMVHLGTEIAAGRATCVVVATGAATEFGTVVDLTSSAGADEIPLQRSLAVLGRRLGTAAVLIAALTVAAGVAAGRPADEMFLTGVSLAVAVVPEGLPAVVTVTLALGVRTMSQRNALLRQLEAAETLGAATVICTDKTGTLTENRMTVTELWSTDGPHAADDPEGSLNPLVIQMLETAQICNGAAVNDNGSGLDTVGDPTEVALLLAAASIGVPAPTAETIREIPFDSVSKVMTVVARSADEVVAHVKGAPEVVLARSSHILTSDGVVPVDSKAAEAVEHAMDDMAGRGLRVLAMAQRTLPPGADTQSEAAIDHDLVLLGLIGMLDPPRPEVPDAVARAAAAGIDVVVMTGDAPETALAVAQSIGLPATATLTGAELERLDDDETAACLDGSHVLARVEPAHKMRIVRLLQERGQVVAMTGDGVNDAPALEQASVGVAMGQRGTDVARGSADVVLADDNFASIVAAIEEGRRQYSNIAKFVAYLLSANLGEVVAVSGTVALGWPLILLPAQILWMNLVTDGVAALALGVERAEPDIMDRPPRSRDEPILTRTRVWWIVSIGALIGIVSIVVFKAALGSGDDESLVRAQTLAFTAMVLLETANVLNFRSERQSLVRIGLATNPWLLAALAASVGFQLAAVHLPGLDSGLGTVGLSLGDWVGLGAMSLTIIVVGEAAKAVLRRRDSR